MEFITKNVNFEEPLLARTAAVVALCPLIWNTVARFEYRSKFLRKLIGSKHGACYAMAVWIFFFSLFRDYLFHQMMDQQPKVAFPEWVRPLSYALLASGQVFVLSSMWSLGVTGTYLGDYCGILMDAPVTGFPFNVLEHPMYVGSSLCFLGSSLYAGSVAGVLVTAWIYFCYHIAATYFEGPFTTQIYANRAAGKKKN